MEDKIMNEELKNQLAIFIGKALDIVEKGIDATGEQIPLILQEIVYWQMSYKISILIFGLILLSISIYCAKRAFCLLKQSNSDDEDIYRVAGICLLFGSLGSLIFSVASILEGFTFFKALVAPRLVIIDYLKGLL